MVHSSYTSAGDAPLTRIAIIGRPNVGKSTLFNRLVGKKLALVDDTPGVTRDRRYGTASLAGLAFEAIDTAGMDEGDAASLNRRMLNQTREAFKEADAIFFVVDVRTGLTPLDETYAKEARKSGKPLVLVLNKAEGRAGQDMIADIYGLGFTDMAFISAEHGEGMADLFDALRDAMGDDWLAREEARAEEEEARRIARKKAAREEALSFEKEAENYHDSAEDFTTEIITEEASHTLPDLRTEGADEPNDEESGTDLLDEEEAPEPGAPIEIAVLGRPNAGKSTLINALIGEDRLLTGPEAGITRDAIGLDFAWQNHRFKLVDTAGLRKRSKITDKLEKLAASDGLRALKYAKVVVLLLDAHNPLEKQDINIAALAAREGRAMVIAVNKWDRVSADKQAYLKSIEDMLKGQLSQVAGVPLVAISALKKDGLNGLMKAILHTHDVWNRRVPTAALNRWLEDVTSHHSPPLVRGRRLKIKYVSQIKTRPPTFTLHCNIKDDFPETYLRYLTSGLRRDFDLTGTPIRLLVRAGKNPYAAKAKKRGKR